MDEVLKASPLESPAAESRRWIGRFLIAVVLGEAIWGFLVSITTNLAQPGMSRVLGADPQSPLYLGRGDINVPALFTSVLELCFAGIVAVILSAWTQKAARTRTVVVRQGPVAVPRQAPAPSAAPGPSPAPVSISAPAASPASVASPPVAAPSDSPAPAAATAIPTTPPQPSAQPAPSQEKRSPQSAPAAAPKKPKKVYYNIVGEAIESDDE
jgi:hypothetical protein